mmetsp:Transcript_605/g.1275  ORF Transcript_605/g.1275 Transcript_605/m.1275 type:complete len:202 (+) Transcript_605:175-780(+)
MSTLRLTSVLRVVNAFSSCSCCISTASTRLSSTSDVTITNSEHISGATCGYPHVVGHPPTSPSKLPWHPTTSASSASSPSVWHPGSSRRARTRWVLSPVAMNARRNSLAFWTASAPEGLSFGSSMMFIMTMLQLSMVFMRSSASSAIHMFANEIESSRSLSATSKQRSTSIDVSNVCQRSPSRSVSHMLPKSCTDKMPKTM